jgi:gentisate 1,2-dioxygenase
VRQFLLRAGEMISAEEADRRVLAMKNPGTLETETARATDTLWAAVQLVMPGEVAPPHRHSPGALRLIVEGGGGYTVVNGSRVEMHAGDFLITPGGTWHEHGHDGSGPMLWLDGLDLPIVQSLHAVFADFDGGADLEAVPSRASALRAGTLAPVWRGAPQAPTLVWPIEDVEAAFADLAQEEGSPYDDLVVEYRDPTTNGAAMTTMGAQMQLLRAGAELESHRHTHSVVYHVVRGEGASNLGGEEFPWRQGDTFAIPSWVEHRHASTGDGDALLFSFNDKPAIELLKLDFERPGKDLYG